MNFGTNDINSLIDCSDNDTLKNDDGETNEDIVNQILNELGDNDETNLDYNHDNFNTEELNTVNFNNVNNIDNNINYNQELEQEQEQEQEQKQEQEQTYEHYKHQNNDSIYSNRFNDDINFKEHILKKNNNKKKMIIL